MNLQLLMPVGLPEKESIRVLCKEMKPILLWEDMTQDLKDYFSSYFNPHRSVATSVSYYDLWNKNSSKYKDTLLKDVNKEIREKLFECLQLKANAGFDDFSEKFGGLTKKEIISRL